MWEHKIFSMSFSKIYDCYIQKVEKKWYNIKQIDEIIFWLTSYDSNQLKNIINKEFSIKDFFDQAPEINENVIKINGSICWYKIQEIKDPLMKKIRYLDKLIDELAHWKKIEKILRK